MDRTVPYDENEICDICGKKGAFDFMGDCICEECLQAERNRAKSKQPQNKKK